MSRGRYIVLEGAEGVGKTTQLELLAQKLRTEGWPVRVLSEPDSQSDLTARAIRQLTQDPRYPMNNRTEVLLYNAARSQSLSVINESVSNGVICLVDRNYLTTLAIQYYGRGEVSDYQTISSIINFAVSGNEPDLTIVLDAPVNVLKQRLEARGHNKRYADFGTEYMERVRSGYLWEAKQRGLPVVFATESPELVGQNIWQNVEKLLQKDNSQAVAEPASIKQLLEKRTQPDRPKANNQSQDKQRFIPVADNGNHETDEAGSPYLELEGVSALLLNQLRQSQRKYSIEFKSINTRFENKTPDGGYEYFVPDTFDVKIAQVYRAGIDEIFSAYSLLVHKLKELQDKNTKHPADKTNGLKDDDFKINIYRAAGAVLPVAAKKYIKIRGKNKNIQEILRQLKSYDLPEARQISIEIQQKTRQIYPNLSKQDKTVSQHGSESLVLMAEIPTGLAVKPSSISQPKLTLSDYWPRNELDMLADLLYKNSSLSLEDIRKKSASWDFKKKEEVYENFLNSTLSSAASLESFDKVRYSWDIICDFSTLNDLQKYTNSGSLVRQNLTFLHGYFIPEIIENSGLTELAERCFAISEALQKRLIEEGYETEAQYAVLTGHNLRCKLSLNATDILLNLNSSIKPPLHPETRSIIKNMHRQIAEVHPLIGRAVQPISKTNS